MIRDQDDPFFGEVDYYSPQEIRGFQSYPIRAVHDFLGAIKDHASRIASIIRANIPIQNAEFDLIEIVKYYQAYCAVILGNGYRGDDRLFFDTLDLYNTGNISGTIPQDELWEEIPNMIKTINRQPYNRFVVGAGMDALIELVEFYQCILCRRAAGLN